MIWPFKKRTEPQRHEKARGGSMFTTDGVLPDMHRKARQAVLAAIPAQPVASDGTMDSANFIGPAAFGGSMPDAQALWYASQGFIGYQMCAIIAQNWLVNKACLMPGRDAVRQGYEITVNSGEGIDPEVLDAMRAADKRHGINKSMIEMVHMARVFGVRVGIFVVESTDPEFYEKPFNIDAVTPGSYRGISQVDPIWMTPELGSANIADPAAIRFYEPTYYSIGGKRYHRSHLAIYIPSPVVDVLKPAYQYGGIPLTQLIYERVYAAERTANEAPQLAMTKRTTVYKTNLDAAFENMDRFASSMERWAAVRDNYGIKIADKEDDDVQQFDTALGDLDTTTMTLYQLVAAVANVPATKLLGTTPKGFNSTGEYEEASYREELESIQADLTPMLERHHALVMRSEIAPRFGIEHIHTTVSWMPLDSPTAAEWAAINKTKAETDAILVQAGAIDGMDVRDRIANDPDSDHHGLAKIVAEQENIGEESVDGGEVASNVQTKNTPPADQ